MDNKMGHQAVHLTIAKVITTLITMSSSMMLSRYCTKAEYGTFSQLTIIITLLTSLIMLGLPNSINYFLAKKSKNEERRLFLSVYYSFSTVLCILVGIVAIVCLPFFIKYFQNESLGKYLYYLGIYPWASITIASISNVLVVYGKTKKLMFINILNAITALIAIGVTYLFTFSFDIYLIIFLTLHVLITIWVYHIVFSLEKGVNVAFDLITIKQVLTYSIPIGLASLVGTITVETDKIMIGGFLDTESLAIYTNAAKELPLTMVATSLTAVLLPKLAVKFGEKNNIEGIELWKKTISISYTIICFFAVSCIIFAPQIITILYSSKYLPGVNVFRVYSCVLILRTTYFGTVLSCTGNTKYILWSSIISLALNIILNFAFYYLFGFIGPAIASFLSILLVGFFQIVASSRIINVKICNIFPWIDIIKITILNCIWGSIAFLILSFLKIDTSTNGIIVSIIIGLVFFGLYFLYHKKKIKVLLKELNEG